MFLQRHDECVCVKTVIFKVVYSDRLNAYVHMYIIIYLCNAFHDGMWNACRSKLNSNDAGECGDPLLYCVILEYRGMLNVDV